jgi:hypothetical protein
MSECSLFVKLLSGDLLTIPILSTDNLTIDFVIDGIQYNYEEYRSIDPNKFYVFPLEHDEKDICLQDWKPEPDETVGLLIYHDEPIVDIQYCQHYIGDNDIEWIKWRMIIYSSSSCEEEVCRFHFFSEVIKDSDTNSLPLLFHENCVKKCRPPQWALDQCRDYVSIKTEEDYIEDGELIPCNASVHNDEDWYWIPSEPGVFEDICDLILYYNSGVPFHLQYNVLNPLEKEWKSALRWLDEDEYYYNHRYEDDDYDD